MRPDAILLALAATVLPTTVLPNHSGKLTDPALQYVSAQCRAAAVSVADPRSAGLEVRSGPTAGRPAALPAPSVRRVVEWQAGAAPGRYVAVIDGFRGGRAVRIRASVDLRSAPCRLTTWRVATEA